MNCQVCNKNSATVHVTEIVQPADASGTPSAGSAQAEAEADASSPSFQSPGHEPSAGSDPVVEQRHLCEECAQRMDLPYAQVSNKGLAVWKLLKESARRARELSALACPDCGMTLAEFRSKGRLGCPRDYEVFHQHLTPLLSKIHNAVEHTGRLPGVDATRVEREKHLTQLRAQLHEAVQEEAYESAARLRDEIQELETAPPVPETPSAG